MRRHMKSTVALFLMQLVSAACYASHPPDNTEWQYWNEFVFEHEFTPRWSMELSLEQNFFDDFQEFGMYNVQLRPFYEVAKPVSLGFEYRCEREREDGEWGTEHRYAAILVLKHEWEAWRFKLTTKPEFRDVEGDDDWRWREKVKIARPLSVGGVEATPWMSEEIIYSFDDEEIGQNRVAIGISKELPWGIEGTLYYLNRNDKEDSGWLTTHVLGTEFARKF